MHAIIYRMVVLWDIGLNTYDIVITHSLCKQDMLSSQRS